MPTIEFHSAESKGPFPEKARVQEMNYCCSADVYYSIGYLRTKADADRVVAKHKIDRKARDYNRSTLSLLTAVCCEEEAIVEMKEHGWNVLQTWASCHGDYPVTLFGLVRKPFNEEWYGEKKKKEELEEIEVQAGGGYDYDEPDEEENHA